MTSPDPRALAEHYRREIAYWRQEAKAQAERAAGLQISLASALQALEMAQAKLGLDIQTEK